MRFLATLFSFITFFLIVGVMMGVGALIYFNRDLPDYSSLKDYQPPILSRIYAGDGRLMATIAAEQRIFVPVDSMPNRLIQAFVAAEDKDFFSHQGVDPQGVLRAILTNIRNISTDRRPEGASTITQQVAKNFLLTNEVSVTRKIKEALLAMRIEQTLSKARILELYLNEIFLGQRSYGVAAAAMNYFNKSLDEMSLAETAYLAALPKGPNNYHPVLKHDAAVERRNWVLGRMADEQYITQEEAAEAQQEPLLTRTRDDAEVVNADYFAEEVRRELVGRYGEEDVLKSGYSVRTSLDPVYQALAEHALNDGLMDYDRRHRGWRGPVAKIPVRADMNWIEELNKIEMPKGGERWQLAMVLSTKGGAASIGLKDGTKAKLTPESFTWARAKLSPGFVVLVDAKDKEPKAEPQTDKQKEAREFIIRQIPEVQGAIIVLDPHTGRVFAMQGGFSMRMSDFNRATQAQRQPGSAFKPFVYLAALDSKFTPSSMVMDAPFAIEQGPGLPIWRPENYSEDFLGPTTLRVGLEKSRNVMTVRLANAIGMDKIVEYTKKFGIADDMPHYLSFSLGAKETTPLKLTTAYAELVSGGMQVIPTFIDRIQDRNGKTILRRGDQTCDDCAATGWSPELMPPEIPDTRQQIADPRTTYQIVSMLQGVTQRGTAARLSALGFPVAGKTGTTNDAKDAWFIGFTPDLVVGVWVGFDDPKPLGSHETGSSVAVPVFQEFMANAMKGETAAPFRVPPGLKLVRVDAHTGRPANVGTEKAIWEAFIPGTEPDEFTPPTVLDGSGGEDDMITGMPGSTNTGSVSPLSIPGTGGLY